jgi:hypothetical protein
LIIVSEGLLETEEEGRSQKTRKKKEGIEREGRR